MVVKSAGAKKIKQPSDLMKLDLIDGDTEAATVAEMIEYLKHKGLANLASLKFLYHGR